MANKDILNYIKETRASGFSDDQIKSSLQSAGWQKLDVDEAFAELSRTISDASTTPISPVASPSLSEPTPTISSTAATSPQAQNSLNQSPTVNPPSEIPPTTPANQSFDDNLGQQPQNNFSSTLDQSLPSAAQTDFAQPNNTIQDLAATPNTPLESVSQNESLLETNDIGALNEAPANLGAALDQDPMPELQGVNEKSRRRFLIPALIAVGVLGIAGIGFAVFSSRSNPTSIIETAFSNWAGVQTYSYSGRVEFNLSDQAASAMKDLSTAGSNKYSAQLAELNNKILSDSVANAQTSTTSGAVINFSGSSDFTNASSVKKSLNLSAPASADLPFEFNIETIVADNQVYLRVNSLEVPSELNLDTVFSQPILLNLQKFAEIFDQPQLMPEAQKLTSSQRPTADDIKTIARDYRIFTDLTTLPSEQISGQDAHHFGFRGGDQFGAGIEQILSKGTLPIEVISIIKDLTSVTGEIWINSTNNLPARITLSGLNGSDRFALDLSFSGFNEAVSITTPTNSKPLGLAIFQLFDQIAKSGVEISGISPAMFIDEDDDGLYDSLEQFYGTTVGTIDTDGDGYSDGEEVKNGYNPAGEGRLPF